ncbi:hypothetical protein ADL03_31720 [Nocardia sp. NRRL S-836]|nr:hypothetical protein ADL03_31720 [Nocardia sp. NRRL S-836]
MYRAAIASVHRLGNPLALVRVHRGLGRALCRVAEWEEAERVVRLAAAFALRSGDRTQQAHCEEALSAMYTARGMHELALEHATASTRLHPGDDGAWFASSFALRARCLAALNEFDATLAATTEALYLHRTLVPRDETGDRLVRGAQPRSV